MRIEEVEARSSRRWKTKVKRGTTTDSAFDIINTRWVNDESVG